jgi:hypothetical protein
MAADVDDVVDPAYAIIAVRRTSGSATFACAMNSALFLYQCTAILALETSSG